MPIVKILQDYGSAEQFEVGQIVDMTNPSKLIAEGKVELYVEPKPKKKKIDPVASITPIKPEIKIATPKTEKPTI